MLNLLDNALRHTPKGHGVRVTVGTSPARPGYLALGVLSVNDIGEGFDPALGPHLFERFYRADPARSHRDARRRGHGSGIGLTISRAIVEAHHGEITAESDGPGHGAGFTLSLSTPPHVSAAGRSRPRER